MAEKMNKKYDNGRKQVTEQEKMEKVKSAHRTGGKQMNNSISRVLDVLF